MSKYIGKIIWEYGDKILSFISEEDDSYETNLNEIEISKEVYNILKENLTKQYYIIANVDKISSVDEIQSIDDFNKSKIKVATYNLSDNKKWITDINLINPKNFSESYLFLDDDVYYYLSSFKLDGNSFYVDSDVSNVTISNLRKINFVRKSKKISVAEDADVLELQQEYIKRAQNYIKSSIDPLVPLYFINFSIINNYLLSKGFVVTNENREEQYLKIIETGDKELLKYLAKYLSILDRINQYNECYEMYSNFLEEISTSDSEEEIKRLWDAYLGLFLGFMQS